MFKKRDKGGFSQNTGGQEVLKTEDEMLFEVLGRSKKAKRRKRIRMILIIVVILAIFIASGVFVLQRQVRKQFASTAAEVLSEQAQRGSISTVVSGSGMLLNVDTEVVSLPAGVEVTEILVEFGDAVNAGDLLAVVDMASVRTAMSELQGEIEAFDKQITAAEGDTVSSYISAGVPGRIKILSGEVNMLVEDAMVEKGGLAVLSLDGFMAVNIETNGVGEGDGVTVILSDGTEESGIVDSVVGRTAVILITDDGPEYGEEVVVNSQDGTRLGSGKLYIHNALTITGYAGTIKTVNVSLNQKVYATTTLFTLTDTSSKASYDALLRSRSEKEATLLELLQIQRYGGVTAPISGSVYSVADIDSEDAEDTEQITELVTLSPDVSMSVTISVDEADILSLKLGQTADVTVSSVSDETFPGIVTEIDKTDSSGAYTAVITLDKVSGMIPGMTASIDVRIEGVEDAILIPADALHQTRDGYYVYTSYDEELQEFGGKTEVIPGLSNSSYVEIKSGLNEGDLVYYTKSQEMFGYKNYGNMGNGGGQMPNYGGSAGAGGKPSGTGRNGFSEQMPGSR